MPKTLFLFNTLDFSSIQALQQKNKDQLKNGTDLCYEMLFNETWPAPSTWDTKKVFLSITVEKLRKMNKRGPTQNCPRLKMSTQPHLQVKGFLRQRVHVRPVGTTHVHYNILYKMRKAPTKHSMVQQKQALCQNGFTDSNQVYD